MVKDKGAPRHYQEWQPEYTPKTHKITAKSKRELDAIRVQSIGEKAIDNFDTTDGLEIGAFVGLTFLFKYGVNPGIMGLFNLGKQVADDIGNAWETFVLWFTGDDGKLTSREVRTRIPLSQHEIWMKMTIEGLVSAKVGHKKTLEGNVKVYQRKIAEEEAQIKQWEDALVWMREKRDQYWAEETMTGGDIVEPAGDRMQMSIERQEYQISNLRAVIDGGDIVNVNINPETGIRGEYVRTVDVGRRQAIILLEEQIRIIADQIDRAIVTKRDAQKIADKLDNLNWIFSMGEAGGFIYLLKSYEMAELVEHIPGQ